MNSLERRVDFLEQRDKGEKTLLWIVPEPDGLEHGGKHYTDDDALLCALGLKADDAILVGWERETRGGADGFLRQRCRRAELAG